MFAPSFVTEHSGLAAYPAVASLRAAPGKPDDSLVSPGIAGFLVTFALALATWFLIRSMVKHLRKVRYAPEPEARARAAEGATGRSDTGRSDTDWSDIGRSATGRSDTGRSAAGDPSEVAEPGAGPEAGDP